MKKALELVFIPSPGIGHLVSTIEIAKLLVARDDHLFISVLIMKLPFDPNSKPKGTYDVTDSLALASTSQRIKFIHLPQEAIQTQGITPIRFFKLFVENYKPHVKHVGV